MRSVRKDDIIRQRHLPDGFLKAQGTSTFAIVNPECPIRPICRIRTHLAYIANAKNRVISNNNSQF